MVSLTMLQLVLLRGLAPCIYVFHGTHTCSIKPIYILSTCNRLYRKIDLMLNYVKATII